MQFEPKIFQITNTLKWLGYNFSRSFTSATFNLIKPSSVAVAQQRAMHPLYHMYIVAVVLLAPASIVAVNLLDISSCDFDP